VVERNKENRKGKEESKIKIEKGPRGNDLAQLQIKPAAQEAPFPNRYPSLSLPLADRWTPPVSYFFSPNFSPLPLSYWKRR
jgi:hypothetical protein